jgi:DNA-binding response OmpR family regulator
MVQTESSAKDRTCVLCYPPLELDLAGLSVSVAGHDVPLTQTEFVLLTELASHPYSVIDRGALRASIADGVRRGARREQPSPDAINVTVARLRHKLRGAGLDCIKTMRNVGYRFVPTDLGQSEERRRSPS